MYAKIEITGKINIETGMHIGASAQYSAIGSVDAPVVRDILSDLPMIPGSSIKGKMRTLLSKKYNKNVSLEHNQDADIILRLFGSSEKGNIKKSRLIFSDMIMNNSKELKSLGVSLFTEIKTENTINRLTAVAMPRQIERVVRGSKFDLNIIYDAEKEEEIIDDFKAIKEGLKLLEYDYLGGNGSRGYGKVKITNLDIKLVVGDIEESLIKECEKSIKEV